MMDIEPALPPLRPCADTAPVNVLLPDEVMLTTAPLEPEPMPVPTELAVKVPMAIEPAGADRVIVPALDMPERSPVAETLEKPEARIDVRSMEPAVEVIEIVPAFAWLRPFTLIELAVVDPEDVVVMDPARLLRPEAVAEMLPRLEEPSIREMEEVVEVRAIEPPEAPLAYI